MLKTSIKNPIEEKYLNIKIIPHDLTERQERKTEKPTNKQTLSRWDK